MVHLWSIQRPARLICLLFTFIRIQNIGILMKTWACVDFRVYLMRSRVGGGGSQETAVMVASCRRSCRRPRSYAQISSTRMTLQKLLFRKTTRCLCLIICATERKPLVGARQSGATGQAEDLPGKIGAYGDEKRFCKKARLRREPRSHIPHWATKAVCSSSSVTAKITTTFQSCHRARRLLHFPRRS